YRKHALSVDFWGQRGRLLRPRRIPSFLSILRRDRWPSAYLVQSTLFCSCNWSKRCNFWRPRRVSPTLSLTPGTDSRPYLCCSAARIHHSRLLVLAAVLGGPQFFRRRCYRWGRSVGSYRRFSDGTTPYIAR